MSLRFLLGPAAGLALALAAVPAAAVTPPAMPPSPGGKMPSFPGGQLPSFPGGLPPLPGELPDGMELPPLPDDIELPPGLCLPGDDGAPAPDPDAEARWVEDEEDPGAMCESAMFDDLPEFKPAFLGRLWRFDAEVSSYAADDNVLNATIGKVRNLPKRFRDQDDEILDADANVLVTGKTRVYDDEGKRIRRESGYADLLDEAEDVSVLGKLLPPAKWQTDEDDEPVVTIRAKRLTIEG